MNFEAHDRAELHDLVAAYAHHADALDTQRWADFFTDDASFTIHPYASPGASVAAIVWEGRPAILAAMTQRHAALRAAHEQRRHLFTNVLVRELTHDSASVLVYLQLIASSDGGAPVSVGTGRYTGRAIRTEHGWRMAKWTLHADQRVPGAAAQPD